MNIARDLAGASFLSAFAVRPRAGGINELARGS